jgi:cell division septal protein FtsQ
MRHHRRLANRAMLLSFIIGALAGIALSPCCRIQHVRLEGPTRSVAEEVRDRFQKAGVFDNCPSITLPLRELAAVAARCYRVKRLAVSRNSPRVVRVRILERQPVAALHAEHGYTLIDEEGICLIRTHKAGALPVVKGIMTKRPELGATISPQQLIPLAECLRSAHEAGIDPAFRLDLSNPHLILLTTSDGVVGKLGDIRDLRSKIIRFGLLLEALQAEGEHVGYIDVRVASRPTWSQRKLQ